MQRTLYVCLFAIAAALCLVKAAPSPVTGTWEGWKDGRKAVTLTVRESAGLLGGTAIFYIIYDNGTGERDGSATPPLRLNGTSWDGHALRFSVQVPGSGAAAFEMTLAGSGRGELKRVQPDGSGEMIAVSRRRER